MTSIRFMVILLIMHASPLGAAEVKLESLQDFDPSSHKVFVNIQVDASGQCKLRPKSLEQTMVAAFAKAGFGTDTVKKSELEFAVSITMLSAISEGSCGFRVLSRVRQIPTIKMLRLKPDSSSKQFQLWRVEAVFTGNPRESAQWIPDQLEADVGSFASYLAERRG